MRCRELRSPGARRRRRDDRHVGRAGPPGPTQATVMLLDAWSTCWLSAVISTGCCPSRHGRRVCGRLAGLSADYAGLASDRPSCSNAASSSSRLAVREPESKSLGPLVTVNTALRAVALMNLGPPRLGLPDAERHLREGAVLAREIGRTYLEVSPGELRVLRYLPTNLSRSEIASELSVSPNTVSTHLRSIYAKLQVRDRSSAVRRRHRACRPAGPVRPVRRAGRDRGARPGPSRGPPAHATTQITRIR